MSGVLICLDFQCEKCKNIEELYITKLERAAKVKQDCKACNSKASASEIPCAPNLSGSCLWQQEY